jgi:pimeloyl-ACP methyl ester carboxylesterase
VIGSPRRLAAALAPALLLAGLSAAPALAARQAAAATCPNPPIVAGDQQLCGSLADGATYLIEVPAHWNHDLFLYSHGYVTPGGDNPAQDVGDAATGSWLLGHGYALAGSSYSTTGWSIQQALPDQIATLKLFRAQVGPPRRTIAWGHSLGGIITAGLIQRYPRQFSAALPMCGVLAGGVATWNTALDGAFAFQQLLDPSVQVTDISDPAANVQNAEQAGAAAQATAAGRARIALAAALGDTPGWFTPLSPEPGKHDYAAQEANQFQWFSKVDFPFIFEFRAELEARAGGNPSWNTGVNYVRQLAKSADKTEVRALYREAGLSLQADLSTLNQASRITADPAAVRYLAHNISFNGRISIPVLTIHTTGDGLVIPENERAYASVVHRAGRSRLLRQVFVHRAGHCAFTPAETITAASILLHRMQTGHWRDGSLRPGAMNAAAAALGANYNIFYSGGTIVPAAPAFTAYQPPLYPRPFDLSWRIRS